MDGKNVDGVMVMENVIDVMEKGQEINRFQLFTLYELGP